MTVLFFVGISFISSFYGQTDSVAPSIPIEIKPNWIPTFKEASKKVKKTKRPLLIYFKGSDWCGPCKILDNNLFNTNKFKNLYEQELVLLEVDIPRNRDLLTPSKMNENLSLQKKYKVKSFPTLILVNHRGRKLAEKKGYLLTEYYYPFLDAVIKNF